MVRTLKNGTILGVLALAGILGAGQALAGPGHGSWRGPRHGPGEGFGGPMLGALRHLDLSDDQTTQVRAILEEERPKMRPLFDQTRASRHALYQAESAATFDESTVRAAAQAAGLAEVDLAIAKAKLNARLRSVLTPEQQQRLDAMRQRFLDRMSERGPGGGRGPCHHGPAGDAPQGDPAGPAE